MDPIKALPSHLHSASDHEIVLPLTEAIEALDLLTHLGWRFLGWEGWIRHADGRLGHSAAYQGTVSLTGTATLVQLGRDTMRADEARWERKPETAGGQLLFCLTFDQPSAR